MSVDPQEMADFREWLAHAPVEMIQKRLDDDTIKRSWKRDMAEAEVVRRTTGGSQFSSGGGTLPNGVSTRRHRAAVFYSWIITVILLISLVLAGLASIMD